MRAYAWDKGSVAFYGILPQRPLPGRMSEMNGHMPKSMRLPRRTRFIAQRQESVPAIAAWSGGAGHGGHAHRASVGVVRGGTLACNFAGELAQLRRVEDPDRLALDLDHAEFGQPRE